jgi:hypothetical protein
MPYFHNQIGLLTETIGNPTPEQIPFIPDRLLAKGDFPLPIAPQTWHFRQSIDYSITANYAVLDFAQRYRETLLYNIYVMGRNAIQRGNRDTWTTYPRYIADVKAAVAKDNSAPSEGGRGGRGGATAPTKYYQMLRKPEWRDPRGYVLPSDQPDFLTATKFMNILIKAGVTVERATAPFSAGGKQYPAGSYVVRTAQAFRPHVLDMFEPQDHPNDFAYPGGPPIPPYDVTGWTLAYQMGVKFDRLLDAFQAPTERIGDLIKPAPGRVNETANAAGYIVNHQVNDAFIAVNRLVKAGEEVYFVRDRSWQSPTGGGVIFIAAKPSTLPILKTAANDLGLTFTAVASRPTSAMYRLQPVRVGLWDQYGGSMPSGHTRWLLEQFEFPFEVVYPQTLDTGNLKSKFDVLIFPDGGIPESEGGGGGFGGGGQTPDDVPAEYKDRLGRVSVKQTIPQLKRFVEEGGAIVAYGGSAVLGHHLGLPISDHLVEVQQDGSERPLPGTKYYVPGAILRISIDNTNPLAYGLDKQIDVFFDNSPVLELAPDAALRGVKTVGWFDSKAPLRSGWAWGQHYLEGGTAAVEASLGKGKVFLFGPEITFRAQPHSTFKFLFNSIYYGGATPVGSGREPTQ